MSNLKSDVALKGTVLRPAVQTYAGEIQCVWRPTAGATLEIGDDIEWCTLAPNIRPHLIQLSSNGLALNTGNPAASGLIFETGWETLAGGTLLSDPDGLIDTYTDAVNGLFLASDDTTVGTVFPGQGIVATKQIYDPNVGIKIVSNVTTANTTPFRDGAAMILRIVFVDVGFATDGLLPVDYARATLTAQGLDNTKVNTYNGQAAGF